MSTRTISYPVDLSGATLDLHWICSGDGTQYLAVREPQNKITALEQTQKMKKKGSCSGRRGIVGTSITSSQLSLLQPTVLCFSGISWGEINKAECKNQALTQALALRESALSLLGDIADPPWKVQQSERSESSAAPEFRTFGQKMPSPLLGG